MPKKVTPIKYTARDFESIKTAIIDHAKRYFPDTYQDFNEASFGSLMVDSVSYVGDVLSFYLDYQINETFIDSAIEYSNVLKLAKQLGYKYQRNFTSSGTAAFFIKVPRGSTGVGPDTDYIPTLKKGSRMGTSGGVTFTLNEDVDFSVTTNRIVVATVDATTGEALTYAIRAYGEVISGYGTTEEFVVGPFEPLKNIIIDNPDVTEIVQVIDSEGHEYFEVDYLSQDVIYEQVRNRTDTAVSAPKYSLRPRAVARRFVMEQQNFRTIIQFGYGSDSTLKNKPLSDVSKVVLKKHGRDYVQTANFDPSNLVETDKLGIAPSNTTLSVTYRVNSRDSVNATANSLKIINSAILEFPVADLNANTKQTVFSSLEVNNEEPIIGDVSLPTADEVRRRAIDAYAAQSRAVTKQDYAALIYKMPGKFGAVKRCSVAQDPDSVKRNLNIYVISEDVNGLLVTTNSTIKENLKFWINQHKMINDTVDILDAKIANIGIEYVIDSLPDYNRFEVLEAAKSVIQGYITRIPFEIGEPLLITDLYKELLKTEGVRSVKDVKIVNKVLGNYSSLEFDIGDSLSPDATVLFVPENVILEVKYINTDIRGTIK